MNKLIEKQGIKVLTILCFAMTLISCTTGKQEPTSTRIVILTATDIALTPTPTKSYQQATSTPLPTYTPQLPASPTPTPLPTLSAEAAEASMINLLQTNNDCELPCWWGLTPGETAAQTTRSFLETFEMISVGSIFEKYDGYGTWFITEDDLIIGVYMSIFYTRPQPRVLKTLHITAEVKRRTEDGGFETVWENPLNKQYLSAYTLPEILSTYGQPNNILAWGNRGWQEFSLVLDYADQGFIVRYSTPLEPSGEFFLGCMTKAYTNLHLWDPALEYSWAEGMTRTTGGEPEEIESLNQLYLPIETATSLTLEEFFQNYQDPGNTTCLETPIDLWPPR